MLLPNSDVTRGVLTGCPALLALDVQNGPPSLHHQLRRMQKEQQQQPQLQAGTSDKGSLKRYSILGKQPHPASPPSQRPAETSGGTAYIAIVDHQVVSPLWPPMAAAASLSGVKRPRTLSWSGDPLRDPTPPQRLEGATSLGGPSAVAPALASVSACVTLPFLHGYNHKQGVDMGLEEGQKRPHRRLPSKLLL